MGIVVFIASVIILALSITISVLISQPFTGAIVRLRANYLPKAVSLDNVLEDGGQENGVRGVTPRAISGYFLRERQSSAKIGPVVNGVFSMLSRTKRLEGWPGVFKGYAPVVCQLFVLGLFTFTFYNVGGLTGTGGGQYRAAPSGPGQFGFWSNLFFMMVTSLVALPLNVITNRAIVHPHILNFRNPRKSLGELLSYSEFAQPWRLYMTPGLLAAELVHITWIGLFTRIVRHVSVPALGGLPPSTPASPGDDTYAGPSSGNLEVSTFGLAFFLSWCVFSVLILSPIECAIVRLSVQRPERQQPLHLAYARVAQNTAAQSSGPAPYNNQAQAQQQQQEASQNGTNGYKDTASTPVVPVIRLPEETPFAIADDEEEEEIEAAANSTKVKESAEVKQDAKVGGLDASSSPPTSSSPTVAVAAAATATATATNQPDGPPPRVLGGGPPPAPSPSSPAPARDAFVNYSGQPIEPVIALRPCDEPQSAEEAARAEEEGFGAPTVERYTGMIDCLNKLVDEEGIEALYRGAWVTLLGVLAGNFA